MGDWRIGILSRVLWLSDRNVKLTEKKVELLSLTSFDFGICNDRSGEHGSLPPTPMRVDS